MQLEEFLQVLQSKTGQGAKRSQSGYSACCPAHDDTTPSLSVSEEADGKILLHCFSGCETENICAALGIRLSDLFATPAPSHQLGVKTVYSYKDEDGQELYRKIRIEPGFDGKSKSFYSERTDNQGQVIRNLKGCRNVLYRLPELLEGLSDKKTVFLVEGEKDADKLSEHSLTVTTSSEALRWSDEFTEVLKEADIVILYDMDATGYRRRDLLCKSLYSQVKKLRVVGLPDLEYQESHGQDISDWLALGHTISELLEIVEKTPDYTMEEPSSGEGEKRKLHAVNMNDFLSMNLPEREMLLSPFLTTQGLVLLYARRGVGKTHVALGIACAVAAGGHFLKWEAPKPRKVLYIDGEMPASAMQDRLRRIALAEGLDETTQKNLVLLTPDLQHGPMPDLATREGRASIEEFVTDSDLIIVDNISSLFRSGVENDAESWRPAQDWALDLRRRGKSILFVHHAGKGGQQRGTSKKEDILDAVISLKNPPNYQADHGAQFDVIFEKTRHFAGDSAASFHVKLREEKDGLWYWDITGTEIDSETQTVADLTNKGYTIYQIVEETGLSKSKVETRQKKARELGLLD